MLNGCVGEGAALLGAQPNIGGGCGERDELASDVGAVGFTGDLSIDRVALRFLRHALRLAEAAFCIDAPDRETNGRDGECPRGDEADRGAARDALQRLLLCGLLDADCSETLGFELCLIALEML